jgi:hypothetical protein
MMATCSSHHDSAKEFESCVRQTAMPLTTSTLTPLIIRKSLNQTVYYQQPTIIRRSYLKATETKYRYALEQVD